MDAEQLQRENGKHIVQTMPVAVGEAKQTHRLMVIEKEKAGVVVEHLAHVVQQRREQSGHTTAQQRRQTHSPKHIHRRKKSQMSRNLHGKQQNTFRNHFQALKRRRKQILLFAKSKTGLFFITREGKLFVEASYCVLSLKLFFFLFGST